MPDPQLLVDQGDQGQDLGAPALRHLEVEGGGDVERLHVLDPGERHVVVGPAPGDGDGHLVGLGPVEDPVAQRREALDDVEGMLVPIVIFDVELGHGGPVCRSRRRSAKSL